MDYIERKLAKHIFKIENLKIMDSNVDNKEYSRNEILENKISLIIGESGRGKSSFLKNIAKEIENSVYNELISLDNQNNFKFEDEKIYLLDSIDEDRNEESEKIYNKKLRKIINEIQNLNIKNKIILTCREGYVPSEIIEEYNIDIYKLLPITKEEINLVLGEEKEQFWNFIKKSNLEEHLGNVVILQRLIKNYKNYKTEVTISEIYMDLCKSFLAIETGNEQNFIGDNHDEIIEELSILLTSKYFLKENFPNESLELNKRKVDKNGKEKLSKVPIFIGDKKEYRVYHKSIEEFLISFYFHKKIEFKELDLKEIISIFFNENYLKIELADIFYFLIELENIEFKRILLKIDPTILVKISNCDLKMKKLIFMENIKILQSNSYLMWNKWDYFARYSNLDESIEIDFINELIELKDIKDEVFYYLMCILNNSNNKKIEDYVFKIIENRMENFKDLSEVLNGVYIKNKNFIIKLNNLIKNKKFCLDEWSYYSKYFIEIIYKNLGIEEVEYYIEKTSEYLLKDIVHLFKTEELLKFLKKKIFGKFRYECLESSIIDILSKEIINRKDFDLYKIDYINLLEEALKMPWMFTNFIELSKEKLDFTDKKDIIERGLYKNVCDYNLLKKEELNEENLNEFIKKFPINSFLNFYLNIIKLLKNNNQLYSLLIKNKKLKKEIENIKEIKNNKKDDKLNNLVFNLKDINQYKEFYELIYFLGVDAYKKIKVNHSEIKGIVDKYIINYFKLDFYLDLSSDRFNIMILICFEYFNDISEKELKEIISEDNDKIKFFNILSYFSYNEFNSSIIEILISDEFLKMKLLDIKNISNNIHQEILLGENYNKIREKIKIDDLIKVTKKLEKKYLNLDLEDSYENKIIDILLLNKENKSLLENKITTKNHLNKSLIISYLAIENINKFFLISNYDIFPNKLENILEILEEIDKINNESNYLEKLENVFIKKIIKYYDKNFKEYKKPYGVFDVDTDYIIDHFIYYNLFKILKMSSRRNLLKELLEEDIKGLKLKNHINNTLKLISEELIEIDKIKEIIKKSKFEYKYYYFDDKKFIKDLLIVIEHLTELRLQIKLKKYKEDEINDLIRFGLEMKEYSAHDQRRGGESETQKNLGERDIVIKQNNIIVTILEALILRSIDIKNIKIHYDKLNNNYDTTGNKINYFISYYLGNNYENFIKKYKNSSDELFDSNIEDLSLKYTEKNNIKIMKTKFKEKEVYHLLINFTN